MLEIPQGFIRDRCHSVSLVLSFVTYATLKIKTFCSAVHLINSMLALPPHVQNLGIPVVYRLTITHRRFCG